jgi:hypothetical protein
LGRGAFDLADIGLVGLHDAATGAKDALGLVHGKAQAMRHEPGGLVRHTERAVDLVAANALLAGRH